MRKYLALVAVGLLALGLVATFGLAKGPAEKTDHNCMGYFVGGFPAANVVGPPSAVGQFAPANAPVNDIATGDANCGDNGAGGQDGEE